MKSVTGDKLKHGDVFHRRDNPGVWVCVIDNNKNKHYPCFVNRVSTVGNGFTGLYTNEDLCTGGQPYIVLFNLSKVGKKLLEKIDNDKA